MNPAAMETNESAGQHVEKWPALSAASPEEIRNVYYKAQAIEKEHAGTHVAVYFASPHDHRIAGEVYGMLSEFGLADGDPTFKRAVPFNTIDNVISGSLRMADAKIDAKIGEKDALTPFGKDDLGFHLASHHAARFLDTSMLPHVIDVAQKINHTREGTLVQMLIPRERADEIARYTAHAVIRGNPGLKVADAHNERVPPHAAAVDVTLSPQSLMRDPAVIFNTFTTLPKDREVALRDLASKYAINHYMKGLGLYALQSGVEHMKAVSRGPSPTPDAVEQVLPWDGHAREGTVIALPRALSQPLNSVQAAEDGQTRPAVYALHVGRNAWQFVAAHDLEPGIAIRSGEKYRITGHNGAPRFEPVAAQERSRSR